MAKREDRLDFHIRVWAERLEALDAQSATRLIAASRCELPLLGSTPKRSERRAQGGNQNGAAGCRRAAP